MVLPAEPHLPLRWSLRGLDAQVLRTYSSQLSREEGSGDWAWEKDYLYKGSALLATESSSPEDPTRHLYLDHLGTPRLETNAAGAVLSAKKYLPYGKELTTSPVGSEVMRFTGHERDEDLEGFGNDLDYMHARFYSPRMGRFLSPDPILGQPGVSQSWNRYAYVMGNPVNYVDPLGLQTRFANPTGETDKAALCDAVTITPNLTAEVSETAAAPAGIGIGGDISEGPEKVDPAYRADQKAERANDQFFGQEGSYFSDGVIAGFSGVSQGTDMMEAFVLEVGYGFALGGTLSVISNLG